MDSHRMTDFLTRIRYEDIDIQAQLQAAAADPRLQAAVRLCGEYERMHPDIGTQQVNFYDELQSVVDGFCIPPKYIGYLLDLCENGLSEDRN